MNNVETEDGCTKLFPVEAAPLGERQPTNLPCPYGTGTHTNIGFYEFNGNRFWIYLPSSCKCGRTFEAEKHIEEVTIGPSN